MKSHFFYFLAAVLFTGLRISAQSLPDKWPGQARPENPALHRLFDEYYNEYLKLNPFAATLLGDNRYNDQLPNEATAAYRKKLHHFYSFYQHALLQFNNKELSGQDRVSRDILLYVTGRELAKEKFHEEYTPVTHRHSLLQGMALLGSGTDIQPFQTVQDYENWLRRMAAFPGWADTVIANFRRGVKAGYTLPRAIVERIIPQMENLSQADSSKSIFYGPLRQFPAGISQAEKARLVVEYHEAISRQLIPAYNRLKVFFSREYLAEARTTAGMNALPNGDAMYRFYIYYHTSVRKSPGEVYQTGLTEVARITAEIEKIKDSIGFKGSLKDLFGFMRTDKQFMPFKTDGEVLAVYGKILEKVQAHLHELFGIFPKTAFEIKKSADFQAASDPPNYHGGSLDGTRPGIFYLPIPDPTKINVTGWPMEATFLHEAIPGHHFQGSLLSENSSLPLFRRMLTAMPSISAFDEGWGLYAESLGTELGCYTDPYQKLGALSIEMHRAVRLVVDAGIHTGKMTREQAITYVLNHESLPEKNIASEIDRYIAAPGQALTYKLGELKIEALRDKYRKQLGAKFSLKNFHDALLSGGSMPLEVLERYMDDWAAKQWPSHSQYLPVHSRGSVSRRGSVSSDPRASIN